MLLALCTWVETPATQGCWMHNHFSHGTTCCSATPQQPPDACAGSVLAPHDRFVVRVQKRLGNRSSTEKGGCQLRGTVLDSQLEHGEICGAAEATRGRYVCVHALLGWLKLADVGVTKEPRGLTEATSRPSDRCCPRTRRGPGCMRGVFQCSSSAWGCSACDCRTKNVSPSKGIQDLRVPGVVDRPLVWTADGRPHPAVTRAMQYAADTAAGGNGQ